MWKCARHNFESFSVVAWRPRSHSHIRSLSHIWSVLENWRSLCCVQASRMGMRMSNACWRKADIGTIFHEYNTTAYAQCAYLPTTIYNGQRASTLSIQSIAQTTLPKNGNRQLNGRYTVGSIREINHEFYLSKLTFVCFIVLVWTPVHNTDAANANPSRVNGTPADGIFMSIQRNARARARVIDSYSFHLNAFEVRSQMSKHPRRDVSPTRQCVINGQ